MTNPIPVANLRATVDIDAGRVPGDLETELRRAGRDLDDDGERLGEDLGASIGRGLSRSSRGAVDDYETRIGADISEALNRLTDRMDEWWRTRGSGGSGRRGWRRRGEDAASEFSSGFSGVFSRLGNVLTGPLGAFFNVGGRSPALLLLLPLLGAIIALITALVYGAQALASQLFLIPSILFAIGLQATTLYLIFDGLGEVIGNALAATNAQELEEALKGVSTQVADVVRQLIPWRDFIRDLKSSAQNAFFGELGTEITDILNNIRGPLSGAIHGIAASMGGALATVLQAFTTPEFARFLEVIGGSTAQWLSGLGPALNTLIVGLSDLGIALDPFLDLFGTKFNDMITNFGEWLSGLGDDPEFMQWMEDSIPIIKDFLQFLGGLWDLIKIIIQQFIDADKEIQSQGGLSFLDALTRMIMAFVDYMATDDGQDAMKGFILLLGSLTLMFFALAAFVILAVNALTDLFDLLKEIFDFIWNDLLGLGDENTGPIGSIKKAGETVVGVFTGLLSGFQTLVTGLVNVISAGIALASGDITTAVGKLKTSITDTLADSPSLLETAGYNMVQGLIAGMRNGRPGLLSMAASLAGAVKSFWPFSPAEQGPLSGRGDLRYAGQSMVQQLVAGIKMEAPALTAATENLANTVNFGPGAVQLTYNGGQPPTTQQATAMGTAAGRGLVNQLLNTQLAVRTL